MRHSAGAGSRVRTPRRWLYVLGAAAAVVTLIATLTTGKSGNGMFSDITPVAMVDAKGDSWGACWGDYDGDGDQDLFVTRTGRGSQLWRNDGGGRLTNVAEAAGLAGWMPWRPLGCAWIDINNDGHPDLFVTSAPARFPENSPRAREKTRLNDSGLFLNSGDGTFREGGAASGMTTQGRRAASVDVADVDNDGDYDAFVAIRGKGPDILFEQTAGLRFRDVSASRGLRDTPPSATFLGSWFDYDGDGDPDLLLNADYWGIELWRNDEGRFTRVTDTAFPPATDSTPGAPPNNPMGVTWGDVDNDGCVDLFVAGWNLPGQGGFDDTAFGPDSPSRLYKGNCDGTFTDITGPAGLKPTGLVEWTPVLVDYDNDGDLDLSVIAGNVGDAPPLPQLGRLPPRVRRVVNIMVAALRRPIPTRWMAWLYRYEAMIPASGNTGLAAAMPALLYRNMHQETGKLTFVEVSHKVGIEHVGAVRGSAWADIDNDGALDWFITGRATPKRLFRNNGPVGHYLRVRVLGAPLKAAIGTWVKVRADGEEQLRHIHVLEGYLSQSQMDPHFGLGSAERVDEILVRWPWTTVWVSACRDVPVNRTVTITQGGGCRW